MSIYLSISDIQSFKSCRQKWDYSSGNRQSLRHKATPRLYLTEGSTIHEAIDAQASGGDPREAAQSYIAAERQKMLDAYAESNGFQAWDIELDRFDESAEFVMQLVEQYFDHYGDDPLKDQGLTYLATEVPFQLELPVEAPSGETVYFVGTWDGVAQDSDGKVFLVENKTYKSLPDSAELMFHDQSTGYAVAFHALTQTRLTGMLYNGIAKRLIVQPKLLKSGKLSVDKRQSVTSKSFIDAILENDLDPYDDDYAEILQTLREREAEGDARFFYQEKFYFSDTQLESWYDELLAVAEEMTNDPKIYRTVPFNGCGKSGADCWFRDICRTEHSGGDTEWVLRGYAVGTYGTMSAMEDASPSFVTSVESLKRTLGGQS